MSNFLTWIHPYATMLVCTAVTAVAGFLAHEVQILFKRIFEDQTKRSIVETCVKAVEQIYRQLDGNTKKQKAICYIESLLSQKGIPITEQEIQLLIESSVSEFRNSLTA